MPRSITREETTHIDELVARGRAALQQFAHATQAEVDRLSQAVAWAVANEETFTRLARMGVEESGIGDPQSRVGKRFKIMGILRDVLRQKSTGIIEELPEKGIIKYAKPVGLIASLVPTTNPELTPPGVGLFAIKCRDAVIFSPHPRSKNTTRETVEIMRRALVREGAPVDLIQCIELPSIPSAQYLMSQADMVQATGGRDMVKAAYSSGTPAYGVGAGNSTMVIDETADVREAARNTRISKTSDFGSGCSSDGNLIVEDSVYEALRDSLVTEGGHLASPHEAEKLKAVLWDDEGHRTADTIAI
jgi:acyl-CoA reductase-like NAD-dependent aldehyde dehydrogenase